MKGEIIYLSEKTKELFVGSLLSAAVENHVAQFVLRKNKFKTTQIELINIYLWSDQANITGFNK